MQPFNFKEIYIFFKKKGFIFIHLYEKQLVRTQKKTVFAFKEHSMLYDSVLNFSQI